MSPRGVGRAPASPLLLQLDGPLAGHVATAMRSHRQWAARLGVRLPPGFDDFERAMTGAAQSGQDGTALEDLASYRDSHDVPAHLLTYDEAARRLACSARQVRRLVADGDLERVGVGRGGARLRAADIEDYAARATHQEDDDR